MLDHPNPFHAGERRAQARAGVGNVADWAAGFIRPEMPDQHRTFFADLPFLVLSGADADGQHWVTLLDGPEGFVSSPDAKTLLVNAALSPQDPLAGTLTKGIDVGVLGIELATRRRNRLSGTIRPQDAGIAIDVRQSFGNCPQYIHERTWRRVPIQDVPLATRTDRLSDRQVATIRAADTLFLGTGHSAQGAPASNGFDASHRGGTPGFVQVDDATHLRIPDYPGNNFFNTIGNLLENPAIGLVFVDFETGGLLHISGRAQIDWTPSGPKDPNALRMIDVTIEAVVDRSAALSLRWSQDDEGLRDLAVTRTAVEADGIKSFYLAAIDDRPIPSFDAGQHLPVELDILGYPARIKRSYSLSGAPGADTYRLTIKREDRGIASRFLHDHVRVGSRVAARVPSGDFRIPNHDSALVLASAGVGLTPMLSMLHAAARQETPRPVWFVHGARDGAHHALASEVAALVASKPNFAKHILYSQPSAADAAGIKYDGVGRITAETLLDLRTGADTHYMLCGPSQWIADVRAGLEAAGVPEQRIHFETFGPIG